MYSLYVISNKPEKFAGISASLNPERVNYFDGRYYGSFSKVVNNCIVACPTETIIIMSDKVLPTQTHVRQTIDLLDRGYAFVALYRFAFFGFKKQLVRKIGFMDEGHVGGGYEDEDFYIRLIGNNLPIFVTEDVPYTPQPSSWNPEQARVYHFNKWKWDATTSTLSRALPDTRLDYDLGPEQPVNWLSGRETSYTPLRPVAQYFNMKINL